MPGERALTRATLSNSFPRLAIYNITAVADVFMNLVHGLLCTLYTVLVDVFVGIFMICTLYTVYHSFIITVPFITVFVSQLSNGSVF